MQSLNQEDPRIRYERMTQTKDHSNYIMNTSREKATVTGFEILPRQFRTIHSRPFVPASALMTIRESSALIIQRCVRGWLGRRRVRTMKLNVEESRKSNSRHRAQAIIPLPENDNRLLLSCNYLVEVTNLGQETLRNLGRQLDASATDTAARLQTLKRVLHHMYEVGYDDTLITRISQLIERETQSLNEGVPAAALKGLRKRISFHFSKLLRT